MNFMKAKLKDIHSPDISDLKTYKPPQEDNFCFLLQALTGPDDELGDETFDIIVCTPKWLIENHKHDRVVFLRHYMLVFKYNYTNIINALKEKIETLNENSWNDLALKISRIGYWEFEDYYED